MLGSELRKGYKIRVHWTQLMTDWSCKTQPNSKQCMFQVTLIEPMRVIGVNTFRVWQVENGEFIWVPTFRDVEVIPPRRDIPENNEAVGVRKAPTIDRGVSID